MTDDKLTLNDVKAIRVCAGALRHLSAERYDSPDQEKPMGLMSHRMQAEAAEAVADKMEQRMSI